MRILAVLFRYYSIQGSVSNVGVNPNSAPAIEQSDISPSLNSYCKDFSFCFLRIVSINSGPFILHLTNSQRVSTSMLSPLAIALRVPLGISLLAFCIVILAIPLPSFLIQPFSSLPSRKVTAVLFSNALRILDMMGIPVIMPCACSSADCF